MICQRLIEFLKPVHIPPTHQHTDCTFIDMAPSQSAPPRRRSSTRQHPSKSLLAAGGDDDVETEHADQKLKKVAEAKGGYLDVWLILVGPFRHGWRSC